MIYPFQKKKKSKKGHQIILSLLKADKENFDSIVDAILSIPLKRNQSHSCRLHGFTNNQILKRNLDNRAAGTHQESVDIGTQKYQQMINSVQSHNLTDIVTLKYSIN